MSRPSNWYDMDYYQQQEWERSEKKHRMDLEDAEAERDRAQDQARRDDYRHKQYEATLRSERDELAEESAGLSRNLATYRQFVKEKGLEAEFTAWEKARLDAIDWDDVV